MSYVNNLPFVLSNSKQIECYHIFKDHLYGVSDLSQNKFNRNEIATSSFDTTVKVFDIEKLKNIHTLTDHTKGVWTLDFSSSDKLLLTAGNDNKIILRESNFYKQIQEINFHDEVIYDVKFSQNGKYFASCSKGMICIWDLKNLNKPLSIIKDPLNDFIFSVNFVDNDKYVVSGFIDGDLFLVDLNDVTNFKKYYVPRKRSKLFESEEEDKQIEFNSIYHISKYKSNRDDEIITALDDGTVHFWKIEESELKNQNLKFDYFTSPCTSVNSSFDNERLIAGSKDHSVLVWTISQSNKVDYSLFGHSDIITCAEFLTDDIVATTSYDSSCRLWKLN